MLNGYVKLGGAKIGGGYMRRKNDGYIASPRNDLWFVGVTYPIGQWTVDAQYNQLKYKDNADKGQLLVLRGTYNLSKRTAAYASLGYMKNSGNAAFGASSAQAGGTPAWRQPDWLCIGCAIRSETGADTAGAGSLVACTRFSKRRQSPMRGSFTKIDRTCLLPKGSPGRHEKKLTTMSPRCPASVGVGFLRSTHLLLTFLKAWEIVFHRLS
jgi:hypothetical protein